MDWTDTQEDAAGIEHQMEMRRLVEQHPWLATAMAGATGVLTAFPGPMTGVQDRYASNLRSHAPTSYRLGAYGVPASVSAAGVLTGNPLVANLGAVGLVTSAARDPFITENRLWGK